MRASRDRRRTSVNVIGHADRFEIAVDALSDGDGDGSNRESGRSNKNSKVVLEAKPLGKPWRFRELRFGNVRDFRASCGRRND